MVQEKWNVFVTFCQDRFSTSACIVCWWMCPAWWQLLTCGNYQECGGWNQYHLVDPDTGPSVVRAWFQSETILFIDVVADGDFDGMMEAKVEPPVTGISGEDEGAVPSSRQWNERSYSGLTRLQENRLSKYTARRL